MASRMPPWNRPGAPSRRRARLSAVCSTLLLAAGLLAPLASVRAETMHTLAIEIDKNANYTPGDDGTNIWNSGATQDRIRDSAANVDVDPDSSDSIAVGVAPTGTGVDP